MSDLGLPLVLGSAAIAATLAVVAARRALAAVPDDDRRWRDRPPRAWRLAWPAVRLAAAAVEPWLPSTWRTAHARLLRQAGLDRSLDAAQAIAGSIVGAVVAGAAAWGLTSWLPALSDLATGIDARRGVAAIEIASHRVAWAIAAAALLGAWLPASWLRERRAERLRVIVRALPFFLDVITLSVESGANLTGALRHAVEKGPAGPLRVELERVLRDVRAGRTRVEALRALAERVDLASVTSWVAALAAAERQGSGLGPILRAQAEQRRQERFQNAEKLAMKAPVKMLFPLLCFVFPCTFVLLFFPIAVRLVEEGLLR
jgi:tight adherence protein C